MIDLNAIQCFVKLGELESFSRAASELRITKTKMSRYIAGLEEELSQSLVYRTTRQVRLTNAGRLLYDSLRNSLDEVDGVLMKMRQAEDLSGTLRLTAPEDMGATILTKLVGEFGDLYPAVRFELLFSERRLNLLKDRIDVAIRTGDIKNDPLTLQVRKLCSIPQILVASPRYIERLSTPFSLEQLSQIDMLLHDIQAEIKPKKIILSNVPGTKRRELSLTPKFSSSSMNSLKGLALEHRGIALVPAFVVAEEIRNGRLMHVLRDWLPPASPVWAVSPPNKQRDPLVTRFKDFLAERSRQYLGGIAEPNSIH